MRFGVVTAVLLVTLVTLSVEVKSLKVASFNIQIFGATKSKNAPVMDVICEVLSRYDVVLIQEIRDSTNKAIYKLLDQLNSIGENTWEIVLSKRLGRTTSKEQYAFLYRPDLVSVSDQYQWPDSTESFEREPFIVRFSSLVDGVSDFAFLGIHIKPDDAPREMDKLTEVYNSVSSMWKIKDMIIGGDFNADCTYVSKNDWKNISLRNDRRFTWTIGDGIDTTMTDSNCAYDRLILAGTNLVGDYVPDSAQPYKFDEELGISRDLALDVSDHYPVELDLE